MQPPSESDLTPRSSPKGFGYSEGQSAPSTQIDAVIYELIAHIENCSDNDFDSQWMHLTNTEVEGLVIAVIRHLLETINGKLLSGYLLESRQERTSAPPIREQP